MLPIFKDDSVNLMLMQTRWAQDLNPLLATPLTQGRLIKNVRLINGTTIINHGLGRNMVGWIVVDIDAAATVYRAAPLNSLTLSLTSNAQAVAELWVF